MDLPKAVTDALAKAAPGASIAKAQAIQLRASLRFGALEKAKIYYSVQAEKGDKTRTIKVKPNGGIITDFEFPKK